MRLRQNDQPAPNNLPTVGAKMGVQGAETNSGIFNVASTAVTAVDFNPATGTGTISWALEKADVEQTDDCRLAQATGQRIDLERGFERKEVRRPNDPAARAHFMQILPGQLISDEVIEHFLTAQKKT